MLEKYKYVGKKIRRERIKYGLSLNELAEELDLSPSFLSLLENGKTAPSLKVLDKICTFFSIHMATLFETGGDNNFIHFPAGEQIEVEGENRNLRFLLPKSSGSAVEPVLITLYPGTTDQDFTEHKGIEFGYIIEGTIRIKIKNKEPVTCKKGDSVLYQADLPHKLSNPGQEIARGIWVGIFQPDALMKVKSIREGEKENYS